MVGARWCSSKAAQPFPLCHPLPTRPFCTSLALVGRPRSPVLIRERAQAPPKPFTSSQDPRSTQKSPGLLSAAETQGKRKGLSCPTNLREAAQAELHSACSRHSKTACAEDQQWYPLVPWPGPCAGTGSNTTGVGCGASWGLSATSPSSMAAALHRALVSFLCVSSPSPALGSARACTQLRPQEEQIPHYRTQSPYCGQLSS